MRREEGPKNSWPKVVKFSHPVAYAWDPSISTDENYSEKGRRLMAEAFFAQLVLPREQGQFWHQASCSAGLFGQDFVLHGHS